MVGALTAADTLLPRAYGSKQYSQMGVLLIQSLMVSGILLIPPLIPLLTMMDYILPHWLFQDPTASALAARWIRVYLLGLPANLLFRVLQRFLVAQQQPWPPVYAAAIPCFGLQPILLPYLIQQMGFLGSAVAIVLTQWTVTLLLVWYLWWRRDSVVHVESWPTRESWSLAWQPASLKRFWNLSLGGVFSLSVRTTDLFMQGSISI
jgi:Na+-driven multidrug efflux pump